MKLFLDKLPKREDAPRLAITLEEDDGDINIVCVDEEGGREVIAYFTPEGVLNLNFLIEVPSGVQTDRSGYIKIVR